MSSLFLAPYVIAQRLPQLWFEALHPNPMVSGESVLAVTEKLEAIGEGFAAAQAEAMQAPFNMALAVLAGRNMAKIAMEAPGRVAKAALAPMERKVRQNFKRLSKKTVRPRSLSTRG